MLLSQLWGSQVAGVAPDMTEPCPWGYTWRLWGKQLKCMLALESHWVPFLLHCWNPCLFSLPEHQGRTWQGQRIRCIKSSYAWLLFTLHFVPGIAGTCWVAAEASLCYSHSQAYYRRGVFITALCVQLFLPFWYSLHFFHWRIDISSLKS